MSDHVAGVPDLVRTAAPTGPNLDLTAILLWFPFEKWKKKLTYTIAIVLLAVGKVQTLVLVCPDEMVRPLVK